MHDHDPTEDLGLTCPSGTDFYVCKNDPERFIGCCAINPCGVRKGLCPDQHLKPATFDKAYEEYISPQACINDNVDVAWHACSWSTSSFMGCCAVDPCNGGCPAKQLRAAKLSDNTKNAECFLGEDYEYEPKPSYTSSSSLDPTTSTSVSSTTAVSTTASSFTTSFLTTSTSDTIRISSPKPTSAPPKEGGGPKLEPLWVLLPFVIVTIFVLWYIMKSKSIKAHEESMAKTDASIKKNAGTKKAFPSDKGADKRTAEPINNYSICPPSQFAGLPPPPVTEKAAPRTNRHDIHTENGQGTVPSPLPEKETPTTRRDFQTEDGQIAVKSEISQTHSAELTQSQINLSINLSSPSPGSSRAFQQDSPFPPPQCEQSQQLPGNDPIKDRHDSGANTPVTTNTANPQLDDRQSVELEATPISRENVPKLPAELDGTSITRIRLSDLPDFHQRAASQPDLGGKALVVPKSTLSEAQRRVTVNLLDSTAHHVKTKDGRVVNNKKTLRTNPSINMPDSRPRLPRQDLAYPPQQPSHQPLNKDISTTRLSRDNVPVSSNPQVGGPDTENEDNPAPELESTGPRNLGVTNPDPREESSGASTVLNSIRVPGPRRTQKRQRPQIPRKPLSPLSEESVGWENGSR